MKKNAILALIMAASMTIAMTSCGKTDEEVSNGTEQPSYNEAMGIDEAVTEAKEEEVVIEPTQEILEADIDSRKIQLGNKVYTLPITLQTLLDDGATITNDVNPINDAVDASNIALGRFYTADVELSLDNVGYKFHPTNYLEKKVQLKDCIIDNTESRNAEIINNVIYPKGIRIGSSIDELKSAWGEPTTDDLNSYTYSERYSYLDDGKYDATANKYYYIIRIDLEKQTITDIVYNMDYNYYTGNVEYLVDDAEKAETSAEESEAEAPAADEESIDE